MEAGNRHSNVKQTPQGKTGIAGKDNKIHHGKAGVTGKANQKHANHPLNAGEVAGNAQRILLDE